MSKTGKWITAGIIILIIVVALYFYFEDKKKAKTGIQQATNPTRSDIPSGTKIKEFDSNKWKSGEIVYQDQASLTYSEINGMPVTTPNEANRKLGTFIGLKTAAGNVLTSTSTTTYAEIKGDDLETFYMKVGQNKVYVLR